MGEDEVGGLDLYLLPLAWALCYQDCLGEGLGFSVYGVGFRVWNLENVLPLVWTLCHNMYVCVCVCVCVCIYI